MDRVAPPADETGREGRGPEAVARAGVAVPGVGRHQAGVEPADEGSHGGTDRVGEIVEHIRATLELLYDKNIAEQARIVYGGPVNPRNIADIVADGRIDGVLAGTASVNADNFANVVRAFSGARASLGSA